jgi:hypothetical protein
VSLAEPRIPWTNTMTRSFLSFRSYFETADSEDVRAVEVDWDLAPHARRYTQTTTSNATGSVCQNLGEEVLTFTSVRMLLILAKVPSV